MRGLRVRLSLASAVIFAAASIHGMAAAPFVTKRCSAKERARFPERREQALVKGTAWMAGFLEDPEHLKGLGADAAVIFLAGQNARSATVRGLSLPLARYQAGRLLPLVTASALSSRSDLFEALWLLSESATLQIPTEPLLTRVSERLLRLPTPESVYAIDLAHLDRVPENDVYELLIDSYVADRAALAHPELPLTTFRLGKVLPFVLSRHFVRYEDDHSEGHGTFADHAYLATHTAFVLSDFARLELSPEDLGPLYGYLRSEFPSAIRYGSLELIAEFVDVFRILGFDDRDDMVCQGTRFLLDRQLPNGGWGGWEDGNAYDQIHATWVAVDALRDRNFPEGSPYATFIKSLGPLTKAPTD